MKGRRALSLGLILILNLGVSPSFATQMKPNTASAFEHYIAVTEDHMSAEEGKGHFLIIDGLSPDARKKAYSELQQGKLYIQQGRAKDDGHNIPVPDGMAHDWIGIVFIPGANLVETLAFLQDADHYQEIFKPAVRQSHLVSWGENEMKLSEQFYHKTIVTVAVNTEFDAHYTFLDSNHLICRAHSTRTAEVEHVGQPDEREMAPGSEHGYLWRMNTYWHIAQQDDGVYLQVQTVALTRNVPAALEWVVMPLVKSIPRATLTTFLNNTRTTITTRKANHEPVADTSHVPPIANANIPGPKPDSANQ